MHDADGRRLELSGRVQHDVRRFGTQTLQTSAKRMACVTSAPAGSLKQKRPGKTAAGVGQYGAHHHERDARCSKGNKTGREANASGLEQRT